MASVAVSQSASRLRAAQSPAAPLRLLLAGLVFLFDSNVFQLMGWHTVPAFTSRQ
jgi:hypothetical protein